MQFEYTNIDLATATRDEIKAEIERMKHQSNDWKNEEQAIKLTINGIYGALGNKWLVCFNPDVAETVTLQGQDLIKFAEKCLNAYFNRFWHKDTEIHQQLGLTDVRKVDVPVNIYSDTDSCYVSFEHVAKSCDWQSKFASPKEFILELNRLRVQPYLNKQFDNYAERFNTVNQQDFELETISEAGIWLAKKKYILDKVWEEGIDIDPLTEIVYKGIELAQSSTPQFARVHLDKLIKYVLSKKNDLDKKELTVMLRGIRDEFRLANPDTISGGVSVNNYEKYVLNDTTAFECADKIPIQVRAAGYYNYLLNQQGDLKRKYEMIRSGSKIKFYYVKTNGPKENNVFAYQPGNYPYEFAPEIDYDLMFEKRILDPVNRITTAMGLGAIPSGLQIIHALI